MTKLLEALISIIAVFLGSAVVAGVWLGMALWHAKAVFEFLP